MGEPTALSLAVATFGWLVVGVIPGWLVASGLAPRRSFLDRLAVSPGISIGLAFPAAAWCNMLGFDVALQAALVSLSLASAAAVAVLVRRRRRGGADPLQGLADMRGLVLPLLLVTMIWCVAMATSDAGWSLVPPNSDGNAHGTFVVRVLSENVVLGQNGYPLGVHLLASLVGALSAVPSALIVPLTFLGSVWTILGVAALASRVSASTAVWAAFAACAVPYFPFGQVDWAPVPLVLAVALVPGVGLALIDGSDRGGRLLAALALAGMLAIHVTETIVVGLLVVLVVLFRRGPKMAALSRFALAAVAALALVAPLVLELAGGGAVRPQDPTPSESFLSAFASSVLQPFVPSGWSNPLVWAVSVLAGSVLVGVAVLGARWSWANPYGRAVTVLIGVLLVLAVATRLRDGVVLAGPWYGNGDRLVAQVAALLPVVLACGFARLVPTFRESRAAATLASVVAVCAALALMQGGLAAQQGLSSSSVVTADDRRAFAWLADHVQPGEEVLNDHRDGSVWMLEASGGGVVPVFGAKPSGGFDLYPEWADRLYLRDHIAQIATDPRVRIAADRRRVRYVFSGERTFEDAPRLIDAEALARTPGVTEVFASGAVRVFELPAP